MEKLCGSGQSTHRYFQATVVFSLNMHAELVPFMRHERVSRPVAPSGTVRNPSGSRTAGQRAKVSGRCGPSGRQRPASMAGPLRSSAIGREVALPAGRLLAPERQRRAFGPPAPRWGAAAAFGRLAASGAKILPQGRRDATEGAGSGRRVGLAPAIPREGDTAPRPARRPLHRGGGARTGPPEAEPLSRAGELRLRRRQECPARTRSVGSRLRS